MIPVRIPNLVLPKKNEMIVCTIMAKNCKELMATMMQVIVFCSIVFDTFH